MSTGNAWMVSSDGVGTIKGQRAKFRLFVLMVIFESRDRVKLHKTGYKIPYNNIIMIVL